VVSPTHAEANRITLAIRDGLKAKGKLKDERIVTGWIPAHLTDAQKADVTHRLSNGSLLTVQGFTRRGDIVVNHGWVIDRDFGHLTHGYCITSHASQGVTVDKVFIGMSSESLPATCQRTGYVAVTRGREQVQVFTDDRKELLHALTRLDNPMSATELSQ